MRETPLEVVKILAFSWCKATRIMCFQEVYTRVDGEWSHKTSTFITAIRYEFPPF